MSRPPLSGEAIYLRPVTLDDVTDRYCDWLNDPEVNQYLEIRFEHQTKDRVREYVNSQINAGDAVLMAIVRKADDLHLGNLRIGAIDRNHKTATVALVIGEKTAWGKGAGSEAIRLATRYAFDVLALEKLTARCYQLNIGSIRAFERAGWLREGLQHSQFISGGVRVDGVWLGCLKQTEARRGS